jgi:hypothetical protein
MIGQWYYSHDGVIHGPFTAAEIKQHAARKNLTASDWIWQGGPERKDAVPAEAAFDFARLPLVVSAGPDWLTDVAKVERKGPLPGPESSKENPEWLEDLRLWYGLELYGAAKTQTPEKALQTGGVPDWLESWITPAAPKTSKASPPAGARTSQAKPLTPTMPPISKSTDSPAPPVDDPSYLPQASSAVPKSHEKPITAAAVPKSMLPVVPADVAASQVHPSAMPPTNLAEATLRDKPVDKAPAAPSAATPSPSRPTSPLSAPTGPRPVSPVHEPFGKTKPTRTAEDVLAEKTIQETGFDPGTGQILDPDKFRQWQCASHASQPAVSNESLFEVFRKARIAVEHWVDEDSHRPLILAGDLSTIKKDVLLLAIFRQFQGFGPAMQEKLMHHLEFMVENRRKYYAACSSGETFFNVRVP